MLQLLMLATNIVKAQSTFESRTLAYFYGEFQRDRPTGVDMTFKITDETNKLCELTAIREKDFHGTIFVPLKAKGYLVTSISEEAFNDCGVSEIIITPFKQVFGETEFIITDGAFSKCPNLETITILSSKPQLSPNSFSNEQMNTIKVRVATPSEGTIVYPPEDYSVGIWGKFQNIETFTEIEQPFTFCSEESDGFMLWYTVTGRLISNAFQKGNTLFSYWLECSAGIESTKEGWTVNYPWEGKVHLTIPSVLGSSSNNMVIVSSIGKNAFSHIEITGVSIPASVGLIGEHAFSFCHRLINVHFPSKSEYDAFIPERKEIFVNLGKEVFAGCELINNLILPYYYANHNPMALLGMGGLQKIEVADGGYRYYSSDGVLFENLEFTLNNALSRFPQARTGNYTIPDEIELIQSYAFEQTSLTSISLSNIKRIGYGAFYYCRNLSTITIPSTVTFIGNYAFAYGKQLTELVSLIEDPVDVDPSAFKDITKKCVLRVPKGTAEKYKERTGWKDFEKIIEEDGGHNVLKVGDTFSEQTIEGVTMTFMVTNTEPMECQVGDGKVACVSTSTSGDVTIPAKPRGYVTRKIADYGFAQCSKMKHCWVNDSIWYIGAHAFDGCTSLTVIDLPRQIKDVDPAFVNIPVNIKVSGSAAPETLVSKIREICRKTGSTVTMNRVKEPAKVEERVYIWPQVQAIEDHFIAYCDKVAKIVVDVENPYFDSREACNAIIRTADNTLLFGCKNTTIPKSVTAIASYAFEGHAHLGAIVLPAGIVAIGNYAFCGCEGLAEVVSKIVHPFAIDDNTFDEYTYKHATLTVPHGTKAVYQNTDGWKNFYNIIEVDEAIDTWTDRIESINDRIMDINDEGIDEVATDINGDGIINVVDIVKIINLINDAKDENEDVDDGGTVIYKSSEGESFYCDGVYTMDDYKFSGVSCFHTDLNKFNRSHFKISFDFNAEQTGYILVLSSDTRSLGVLIQNDYTLGVTTNNQRQRFTTKQTCDLHKYYHVDVVYNDGILKVNGEEFAAVIGSGNHTLSSINFSNASTFKGRLKNIVVTSY